MITYKEILDFPADYIMVRNNKHCIVRSKKRDVKTVLPVKLEKGHDLNQKTIWLTIRKASLNEYITFKGKLL